MQCPPQRGDADGDAVCIHRSHLVRWRWRGPVPPRGLGSEPGERVRASGAAAHHLVAGGAKAAAPARAALEKFGIGINDAANGVFLSGSVHSGIHANAYYETVNELLGGAISRQQALDALEAIRQGVLSGGFP